MAGDESNWMTIDHVVYEAVKQMLLLLMMMMISECNCARTMCKDNERVMMGRNIYIGRKNTTRFYKRER